MMDSEKSSPPNKRISDDCNSAWPCLRHVPQSEPPKNFDGSILATSPLVVNITKEEFAIGRMLLTNDFLLDGKNISRNHAKICKKNGEWFYMAMAEMKDCINGYVLHKGDEKHIKDNDMIRISYHDFFTYKFKLGNGKKTKFVDTVENILAQGKVEVDNLLKMEEDLQINLKSENELRLKIQEKLRTKSLRRESLKEMLREVENDVKSLEFQDEEKQKNVTAIGSKLEDLKVTISNKCKEIDGEVKKAKDNARKLLELEEQNIEEIHAKSIQEITGWRPSNEESSKDSAKVSPSRVQGYFSGTWLNVKQEKREG